MTGHKESRGKRTRPGEGSEHRYKHRKRGPALFWPSPLPEPPPFFLKRLEEAKIFSIETARAEAAGSSQREDAEPIGPLPLPFSNPKVFAGDRYGSGLLPGEGSAMAAFASSGKRIPRRGEIGLSSEAIESFEKSGFVMSGSRHYAMNAMRQKKESLVLTAEQQKRLAREHLEEKMKRENVVVSRFKDLVQEQIRKFSQD